MATPGYPQQMQPQPPMGQYPQMGRPMMPPRPIRRGTSRAVPVVISAGLAVGVFCGLLFGLGTGASEAATEPAKTDVKTDVKSATPAPKSGTAPAPAGGGSPLAAKPAHTASTAPTDAGTPTPSAASANTIKLTVEVTPSAAAAAAKISIDGKEITGKTIEIPSDKKSVAMSITAPGFHSVDKKIELAGPGDTTIKQEMAKRGGGGTPSPGFGGASTGGNHVPTAPPKPKKPPNSGIIDI